ncbi:hypothetical protein ACHAXR_010356 [Thalassiosira sp. AJA248-18]
MDDSAPIPLPAMPPADSPPAIPPMAMVTAVEQQQVDAPALENNMAEEAMVASPTELVAVTANTEAETETNNPPSPQKQDLTTKPLPPSISFDAIFSELQAWQQQNNGSLSIPTSHPALSRIADALTGEGIENIVDQRWDEQLAQLREYKSENGNCNVPFSHPTLGKWVSEQRKYFKLYELRMPNPLTPARFEQLKMLSLTVNLWEKRLEDLKLYKAQNGHCDVPLEYPKLGVWVLNQRDTYHFEGGKMPQDRVDALEAMGFNWNRWGRNRLKVREDAWDVQFNKLLEYIKEHGHSNISQHDKENERLGKWIKNQRYEYRKYHNKGLGQSRLGRDRIDKLNEIGFQWRLRPERIPWDERFKAIVQYKEEHGHCRVPMNVPELGKWAKYQRDQYCLFMRGKKAKINQQKIDKLISIGFEDSLEERVALGLSTEGGGEEEQEEKLDHAQGGEVAYQHHEENVGHAYVEQYHHGDPAHTYGNTQEQPGPDSFHYQHGVHFQA